MACSLLFHQASIWSLLKDRTEITNFHFTNTTFFNQSRCIHHISIFIHSQGREVVFNHGGLNYAYSSK